MAGGELTLLHDSNIRTNPINNRFAQKAVVPERRGERALRSYGHERRPRKNTRAKSSHCSPLTRECFNQVVRAPWGAENRLHGRRDVVMNEDHDRSVWETDPTISRFCPTWR